MQKEKISKEIIKSRYEIFNEAKKRIKNEFYGIDDVIEKVFKAIETWYIYPEFMTRPCIINLWGLTGVGKTDLVQKIRTYLKIDKYASTEMDNNSNSYAYILHILFAMHLYAKVLVRLNDLQENTR